VLVVVVTVVVVAVDLTALSELPPQAEAHKSKQKKTINFFTRQYVPLLTTHEIPARN